MKLQNPVRQNLDDFLLDCELRNLTQSTIICYKQKLSYYFQNYDFTQEDINRFIIDKKSGGSHIPTINSYLRTLKAYGKYLNSDVNIRLLKEDISIKEIYSAEEIQRLIKKPNTKSFTELKTWMLVNFLLGTGCRISTALEVQVEDIDFDSGYILFRHSKNHKPQYFPLSKGLIIALKQYLKVRGDSGYLFCNQYGDRADRRSIQQQVADYNKARKVNKTSCHLFRNTFAANYIRNGGDAFRLQKLLNHSTLDMTRKYVELYSPDLKDNLEVLSPLDINIKNKIRL